jgi:hypothetical protein
MERPVINLTPFTRAVTKASKASAKSSSEEIGVALGRLVSKRLQKRSEQTVRTAQVSEWRYDPIVPQRRRRTVRRGRNQPYRSTTKVDISRLGTFRRYMLSVIRRHNNTWDAMAEHEKCDNERWAKNKLDFAWAAAEGYIDFSI